MQSLPLDVAVDVEDLLDPIPADEPYTQLEDAVIQLVAKSENRMLWEFFMQVDLGDQTPSQLMRQMRSLLAGRHMDDAIFRQIWLLKELAAEISKALAFILQTSFVTGCLPSEWKSATITRLFKGGSRASANNYRLVSLTSICCTIMEKIIKKSLMQFLEQHHFLSVDQHSFRSGRSCLTNLLFTLERWTKARDEGNVVQAIYIDCKMAFANVPHQRLLHKLRNFGIRGRLLV
nr:unnamed protein product [Spirometra erinaceieuropaei]